MKQMGHVIVAKSSIAEASPHLNSSKTDFPASKSGKAQAQRRTRAAALLVHFLLNFHPGTIDVLAETRGAVFAAGHRRASEEETNGEKPGIAWQNALLAI